MRDQKYQTAIVVFKCGTAMATPGWNVSFTHVVVLRVFEVVQLMVNTMNPMCFGSWNSQNTFPELIHSYAFKCQIMMSRDPQQVNMNDCGLTISEFGILMHSVLERILRCTPPQVPRAPVSLVCKRVCFQSKSHKFVSASAPACLRDMLVCFNYVSV